MRSNIEARPKVAKLINEIERINNEDTLHQYVMEIASFYTSECKTDKRILEQYELDIKSLVLIYKLANDRYCGYRQKWDDYSEEIIKPDERYKIVVDNILQALDFLIHQAASNKVFLPLEKLEELGLKEVKYPKPLCVPIWNVRIESVYDSAIQFYKAHGFVFDSDLPEIPEKLARIFGFDKRIFKDFSKECEGKDLVGVAEVYVKYARNGLINKSRAMKPIFNHFVSSDDSQYMTFTRYAKC